MCEIAKEVIKCFICVLFCYRPHQHQPEMFLFFVKFKPVTFPLKNRGNTHEHTLPLFTECAYSHMVLYIKADPLKSGNLGTIMVTYLRN